MTRGGAKTTMRSMVNRTQLIPSTVLAVCAAAAIAPAAAPAASIERGAYEGRTAQPASGGAAAYRGKILLKLGLLSNPARIVRFGLTTRLLCADGTTRDDKTEAVIYGPRLDRRGRFSYVADGLVVSGRFKPGGTASGTLSRTVGDCSISGVSWTART
jgi:hypothetical protein